MTETKGRETALAEFGRIRRIKGPHKRLQHLRALLYNFPCIRDVRAFREVYRATQRQVEKMEKEVVA